MPKYTFVVWEEAKYAVTFEADSEEHARELLDDTLNVDDLPDAERVFVKGSEHWETDVLWEKDDN